MGGGIFKDDSGADPMAVNLFHRIHFRLCVLPIVSDSRVPEGH